MNAEQLLAHYNRIADAPEAMPRLRRFILDLAVRGKLVRQDPNDEPASELLKRINEDVKARKGAGDFREPTRVAELKRTELPFEAPSHWAWARLIEIARPSYGFAFKSSQFNSNNVGMPLIRIRDISKADTEAYFDGDYDETYIVTAGDFLVGMDGNFNLERWRGPDALLNQRVMRINDWRCGIDPEFVRIPLVFILDHVHGGTSQTTVKHLSAKQVNGIEMPLPPLAEQHRIVVEVDELMALCNRLEAARDKREVSRDRLAAASLARLNAPDPDPAVFQNHAAFTLDNLTPFTTRPDQIKALRQTILNLAVRGKLVPQDPNDEPASELLKRIAAEKARLVKAGGGRTQKPGKSKDVADLLFRVPKSWRWVSLSTISHFENGDRSRNYPSGTDIKAEGIPFISTKNISDYAVRLENLNFITEEKFRSLRSGKIENFDILISLRGSVGKLGLFQATDQYETGFINAQLLIIRNHDRNVVKYCLTFLKSQVFLDQIFSRSSGSTTPQLSAGQLAEIFVTLPPIAEQHRIVAKVDELMALCDRLEAILDHTDATRRRLLDAILHAALEPAKDREQAA